MPIDSQVEVKQVRLVKGTGAQIETARQAQEILETDLVVQTDAPDLVTANTAITGATKCKITYDSKGLVTAGADLASSDITTALGYTPYNSSNPSGYITGITSSMVTTALGYTPYNSTNPSGYQANVIETVKVNGTALTPSSKAVDITVPTVNNPTITITQGGVTKGSFTLNQANGDTIALDAGGSGGGAVDSVNGQTGTVVLDAEDVGAVDKDIFVGPYYGTCSTAASTLDKVVSCSGLPDFSSSEESLKVGTTINVKFTYKQGSNNGAVKLNVNNYGLITVKAYYSYLPEYAWNAGDVISFVYDGAYWQLVNPESIWIASDLEDEIDARIDAVNDLSDALSNEVSRAKREEQRIEGLIPTQASDIGAVAANTAITGATKCKITYDSKGLVTAGADLASSDVTSALGYTPQQQLVSGTNIKTINNTSILGSGNLNVDGLPSQTGQSGKFLSTNGTDASWSTVYAMQIIDYTED